MRTLYVTDLDGTLLGRDGRISARTRRALDALYAAGVCISPVTSRSYSAIEVLEGTRFCAPWCLLGGARLYDAQARRLLGEHTYETKDAAFILDAMKARGLTPFLYAQDENDEQRVYYERGSDERALEFIARQRAKGDGRFRQVEDFSEKMGEKLFIVTVRGEESVLRELRDEFLRRGLHAYLYHAVRLNGACSLETAAVSKCVGVRELRALTGAERVVAFGDNGNDVGMFEAADVRIAVGNATQELKALADRVIGPHDADSVAREICEMEGIKWEF